MAFEVKKETKNTKAYIGFNINENDYNQLVLVSVYIERFKSTILRKLIKDFLKTQPTTEKIISLLAKQAHREWDELCIKMDKKNGWKTGAQLTAKWDQYVLLQKRNLKKRRLHIDLIDFVIAELEQLEIDR